MMGKYPKTLLLFVSICLIPAFTAKGAVEIVVDRNMAQTGTDPFFVSHENSLRDDSRLNTVAQWTISMPAASVSTARSNALKTSTGNSTQPAAKNNIAKNISNVGNEGDTTVQNFYAVSPQTSTVAIGSQIQGISLPLSDSDKANLTELLKKFDRISFLGKKISSSGIESNSVKLGDQTKGNYVEDVTNGNGIDVGGSSAEGWSATVSLGNLSGDWNQNGAHSIVLNNKDSDLKMRDNSESHIATFDVAALGGDATYTFSSPSGTVITTSNLAHYLGNDSNGELAAVNNLSDVVDAAEARTNLGLGSLAIQNAGSVNIAGGSINGVSISAASNTISGLANSNLSGSANISNANLANSSFTINGGTGISGGGNVALGGSLSITNSGVTALNGETGGITITGGGINNINAFGGILTVTATEIDTLNAVTGRGSATNNALALNGGLTVGGSTIINSSGALQTAGLIGTYGNSLSLSSASNAITAGTLTATGGAVNGVTIGADTPAASAFTTLASSGATSLATGAGNALTLGNILGTVEIKSSGLNASTAGVLSGISGYLQSSGNMAISGNGTLSTGTGAVSLNGDATISAGKDLILASGDGNFTQNFSASSGVAHTLTITNSGSSGTNSVKGIEIDLAGTSGGTNTASGISFGNVTPVGGNTFNGITFGTGLANFIASPTVNLSAAGNLSGLTGLTLVSGNIDQSASAGTLKTGTGAVTLNGDTTVAAGKILAIASADSFTVGGNKIPQTVFVNVPLLASVLTQAVFIADRDYQLTSAGCFYPIAAALGGTLQITVDSGSQAPGAGTNQLSSSVDLSGSINAVQSGTLIGSPTIISTGNRISTVFGGTLTGLLGTCTLGLKPM